MKMNKLLFLALFRKIYNPKLLLLLFFFKQKRLSFVQKAYDLFQEFNHTINFSIFLKFEDIRIMNSHA